MSEKTLTFRNAGPADAETVTRFNIACARESEDLELDPAVVGPGVRAVLGDPDRGRYFIAEDEAGPAGQVMITFEWSDWRNAWIWWLQSVYVRSDARRRGVFSALYEHVEAEARAAGVAAIRLYVDLDNERAERTYLRAGFERAHYRLLGKPLSDGA